MTDRSLAPKAPGVHHLRCHILRNRTLVGVLVAFALAMKLLMPSGYMPAVADRHLVITICTGSGPVPMAMSIPVTQQEMPAGEAPGKVEAHCAFGGLSMASLGPIDPALLAAAILFLIALGMGIAVPLVVVTAPHLRPPSRGPPLTV